MLLGEFFIKDLEKGLSNVGDYIVAVWGVKPSYFPLSILPFQSMQVGMGFGVKR